jgi:hypothetical protein
MSRAPGKYVAGTMAPAGAALDSPGLELFIHKVAYTKYDAIVLVRWFNCTKLYGRRVPHPVHVALC